MHAMEIQQSWRVRLSFKNATILVTILNVMAVLFLLHGFLSSSLSSSSRDKLSSNQLSSGMSSFSLNNLSCFYLKRTENIKWVLGSCAESFTKSSLFCVFIFWVIFIFILGINDDLSICGFVVDSGLFGY